MINQTISLFQGLSQTAQKARQEEIPADRKQVLSVLIDYIQHKVNEGNEANLNFICTHNSRRSQFAQIWAQTAADYFGIQANCYSGGVEVTSLNERAIASLERSGFRISSKGDTNPTYAISHSSDSKPITAFSKLFDHPKNKADQFAAVMTCSHADENCPFISGTEKRISVRYDDPKEFDNTPQEAARYDERSMQIAAEMFFVFTNINP